MKEEDKDLNYWEANARDSYMHTPICVLRYITELEKQLKNNAVLPDVSGSLPLQTKLEMFYDFLFERGIAKQLGIGIDTIVKHFIDERLSDNDS